MLATRRNSRFRELTLAAVEVGQTQNVSGTTLAGAVKSTAWNIHPKEIRIMNSGIYEVTHCLASSTGAARAPEKAATKTATVAKTFMIAVGGKRKR